MALMIFVKRVAVTATVSIISMELHVSSVEEIHGRSQGLQSVQVLPKGEKNCLVQFRG